MFFYTIANESNYPKAGVGRLSIRGKLTIEREREKRERERETSLIRTNLFYRKLKQ